MTRSTLMAKSALCIREQQRSRSRFHFAVARGVPRSGLHDPAPAGGAVTIRCREGRTAEPARHRIAGAGEFLFAVARGVQRNPTLCGEAVTSTNDVRFHTRRPEPFSEGVRRPLVRAFVLVRGLHTRGPPERSSRQPPVFQVIAHIGDLRRRGCPEIQTSAKLGRREGVVAGGIPKLGESRLRAECGNGRRPVEARPVVVDV